MFCKWSGSCQVNVVESKYIRGWKKRALFLSDREWKKKQKIKIVKCTKAQLLAVSTTAEVHAVFFFFHRWPPLISPLNVAVETGDIPFNSRGPRDYATSRRSTPLRPVEGAAEPGDESSPATAPLLLTRIHPYCTGRGGWGGGREGGPSTESK